MSDCMIIFVPDEALLITHGNQLITM